MLLLFLTKIILKNNIKLQVQMKLLLLRLLKNSVYLFYKELKQQLKYKFQMVNKSIMKFFILFHLKVKLKEWESY